MKFFILLCTVIFAIEVTVEVLENEVQKENNKLTGNMLSIVAQENPVSSIILSALSVLTPLAQLTLGSEGKTHDELLDLLTFPNDGVMLAAVSYTNNKLKSTPGVELKIASRIYIPLNYELDEDYAFLIKDSLESEVKNVNFASNVQTAAKINEWVESETNYRIKNLIDPSTLDASVRLVLVNALYFKGTWNNVFNPNRTTPLRFYITKKDHIEVPMMHKIDNYKHTTSQILGSQILELPYVGGESSMVIILPDDMDGINGLMDKLDDLSILDNELQDMASLLVNVFIPKFKIETKIDLKTVLQEMNVTEIFQPGANFNKMLKNHENLSVSQAIQKAFIEVDELGTEAAAANEVTVVGMSPGLPPPVFNANHPFVFLLRSKNITLFSGIYRG